MMGEGGRTGLLEERREVRDELVGEEIPESGRTDSEKERERTPVQRRQIKINGMNGRKWQYHAVAWCGLHPTARAGVARGGRNIDRQHGQASTIESELRGPERTPSVRAPRWPSY